MTEDGLAEADRVVEAKETPRAEGLGVGQMVTTWGHTYEPREPISLETWSLWTNPNMKRCPSEKCHFVDPDQETVNAHYLSEHGQVSLNGKVPTEEEKRMALLAASDNPEVTCPFCFGRQGLRAARLFNEDGTLSKKVRCVVCKAEMSNRESMEQIARGPREFGAWVGKYGPAFWFRVDHDKWIASLKAFYPKNPALEWDSPLQLLSQFWEGYGSERPEWAEKQRIARQTREYEKEQQSKREGS